MAREEYRRKRHFGETKEPEGADRAEQTPPSSGETPVPPGGSSAGEAAGSAGAAPGKREGLPIFVVQEHHASRLHWDFRLEMGGALKSWAVPKGPPEEAGIKRLAQMVEDHPLEYASFEGGIPAGEYGAGSVKLWDRGTWEAVGEKSGEEQLAEGAMKLVLHGERLQGGYALVRFQKAGENSWLLIKSSG